MRSPSSCLAAAVALLLALAGCSSGGSPAAPPDGWEATETRWWKSGVDTTQVFRSLEDLDQMGIRRGGVTLSQRGLTRDQFVDAIKRSLVALYRHAPETIDSLFNEHATPRLQDVQLSNDVVREGGRLDSEFLNKHKSAAYNAINSHYREPRRLDTGESPSIIYPDSLRTVETSGEVQLQVHLSVEGDSTAAPDAIEVLRSVHPTLDAIAMKAASQLRWQPAYLLQDGTWTPQPAWVRFDIEYPAPR